MMKLLHHNISVCAQKVRLALDEKGLAYETEHVDLMQGGHLTPDFLKMNPKGLVPVLIDDGVPIYESTVILEYVEDVVPEPPLRPRDAKARAHMRVWSKIPDEGLHYACATVTYVSAFAGQMKSHHDREELEKRWAKLPDQARAERQRQLLRHGFDAPFVRDAIWLHDKVLHEMQAALSDGRSWLMGADYTLADIALIPYVTRLDRLGLHGMWARRPHLADWFARVQARPNFHSAVTAWRTDVYDDELKKRGIDVWPQVERLLEEAPTRD